MGKMYSAILVFGLLLSGSGPPAWADTRYELRVDGLACPYCAYGIEKKLKALDGVNGDSLKIKLNEGIVKFDTQDATAISESQLKQLINDSGFTMRSVTISDLNPVERGGENL